MAIGERDVLGAGLGSRAIREFVNGVVFADPTIRAVLTDPEEKNLSSLRAFEKAGFVGTKSVRLKDEAAQRRVVRLERGGCAL